MGQEEGLGWCLVGVQVTHSPRVSFSSELKSKEQSLL